MPVVVGFKIWEVYKEDSLSAMLGMCSTGSRRMMEEPACTSTFTKIPRSVEFIQVSGNVFLDDLGDSLNGSAPILHPSASLPDIFSQQRAFFIMKSTNITHICEGKTLPILVSFSIPQVRGPLHSGKGAGHQDILWIIRGFAFAGHKSRRGVDEMFNEAPW